VSVGVVAVALGLLVTDTAHADAQISARLAAGGGVSFAPDTDADGLFELAVRSEMLFGPASFGSFRAGAAIDLRTDDFVTAEAAGGVALLVPVAAATPVTLTAAAGWASRPGDADGPFALGTIAWGLRSYNHHAAYGFGLQVYVTTRVDLEDASRWQLTAGIEIDLLFLVVIPALFVWRVATASDPDEPG
jgi:hypothetical protein